jgi:hypothetical protein
MVKRTLVVLAVLSAVLMMVGTSFGQCGGGGWCRTPVTCPPLYVPVDCCPYPESTTVIQKWSCKIEGPCPPPQAACGTGRGRGGSRLGLIGGLAAAIATPFDAIFGGPRGVYGCRLRGGGMCGPCRGPIPNAVVAIPKFLAAPTVGILGPLW